MDIIIATEEERHAIEARRAAFEKELEAFMQRTGATSAEAIVMSDPPVSDVDAD